MPAATKDAVLASAVDLARAAAVEEAGSPDLVGEHLGLVVEGERLVSHRFATTAVGQRGWEWTVTVARVPRGRTPSVCEVHLLPGADAVLAPTWVPWADRLRPGDVGAGDVLPYLTDDERLDQGYEAVGDADADEMAIFELGLGRPRVLSRTGRSQAAERWYAGSHGPTAPQAIFASAPCSTCAFLVLMAGSLRTEFGVCANEWSPDDGKVVSMDHGCGAHSETDVPPARSEWPDPPPDAEPLELVELAEEPAAQPETAREAETAQDSERAQEADTAEEALPAQEAQPAQQAAPADEPEEQPVPGEE